MNLDKILGRAIEKQIDKQMSSILAKLSSYHWKTAMAYRSNEKILDMILCRMEAKCPELADEMREYIVKQRDYNREMAARTEEAAREAGDSLEHML